MDHFSKKNLLNSERNNYENFADEIEDNLLDQRTQNNNSKKMKTFQTLQTISQQITSLNNSHQSDASVEDSPKPFLPDSVRIDTSTNDSQHFNAELYKNVTFYF